MKIWDKKRNEVPSFSEALGIKKGDVVQIAGSGGKTTLSYTIANENSHLKVAVVTTTKRFAPKENAVLLKENENDGSQQNLKALGLHLKGLIEEAVSPGQEKGAEGDQGDEQAAGGN